jgi:hypothetical protein
VRRVSDARPNLLEFNAQAIELGLVMHRSISKRDVDPVEWTLGALLDYRNHNNYRCKVQNDEQPLVKICIARFKGKTHRIASNVYLQPCCLSEYYGHKKTRRAEFAALKFRNSKCHLSF